MFENNNNNNHHFETDLNRMCVCVFFCCYDDVVDIQINTLRIGRTRSLVHSAGNYADRRYEKQDNTSHSMPSWIFNRGLICGKEKHVLV